MIMEEKWFGRIWTKEEETLINLIEKNGELFEEASATGHVGACRCFPF